MTAVKKGGGAGAAGVGVSDDVEVERRLKVRVEKTREVLRQMVALLQHPKIVLEVLFV